MEIRLKDNKKERFKQKADAAPAPSLGSEPFVISSLLFLGSSIISLIGLSAVFYGPSLWYSFQFDDVANITRSFGIRHGTFSSLFLQGSRWISYWLNSFYFSLARFNPFPYRLGNVCLHTLASIMLFLFLYYALKAYKKDSFVFKNHFSISLLSAGLFLLHPVQTQTVCYVIQGQLEGMAGLFIIGTLLFFIRFCQSREKWSKSLFATGMILMAFLACGSKEISIIIPFLMLITDWFFIAHGKWSEVKSRWYWHGGIACIVWGIYLYFLKPAFFVNLIGLNMEAHNNIGNVLNNDFNEKIRPIPFFLSQFKVIVHYLLIFIWPFSMSVEYDWKMVKSFFAPDCIIPFLFLLCCLGGLWRLLRRDSINVAAFSMIWFIIATLPRSSIIPSSELMADYKTYVASVGAIIILSMMIVYMLQKAGSYFSIAEDQLQSRWKVVLSLIVILLPIGYVTYERNKVWRTAEEFWWDIILHAPGKARAYNNYAVALSERGAHKEAIPFYQKAIAMDKNYPDPLNNIAVSYAVTEQLDKGIMALKQAIILQPHYPEAYNNLASFLIKKNELEQAEKLLGVALQLRPYYGKAFFNLGKINLMRNKPEEAFNYFKKACLEGDLDNEPGFKAYAEMSCRMLKWDHAIIALKKLLEIAPQPEYQFNLANAYFSCGKYQEAAQAYHVFTRVAPNDMRGWYNLGESYLKLNNTQAALSAFERVMQFKDAPPATPLRCAFCLGSLGRDNEAKILLNQVLSLDTASAGVRKAAEGMLGHLERKETKG